MKIGNTQISLTTVQGILSFLLTIAVFVQPMLVAGQFGISAKFVFYFGLAIGVAKMIVGYNQKDAGTQTAIVPGQGVQTVESHETPNDPTAKPVAK